MKIFLYIIIGLSLVSIFAYSKSFGEVTTTEDLFNEAMLAINASNYEKAISIFDQILEIDPSNIVTLSNRGSALIELERYEKAIASFDRILSMNSTDTQALNNKGVALTKLQKYDEAISNFDKILEVDPDHKNAKQNRFLALKEQGHVPDHYLIQVQVQIRDINGNLVGVIDTPKQLFQVDLVAEEYLNLQPISEIYEEDGKIFEKREIVKTFQNPQPMFVTKTLFDRGDSVILFEFLHHSFGLDVGDIATAYWIIVSVTEIT